MDPDYFDICAEDRMMGLTGGFYDPSDEGIDFYDDESDYYDELDDCEE